MWQHMDLFCVCAVVGTIMTNMVLTVVLNNSRDCGMVGGVDSTMRVGYSSNNMTNRVSNRERMSRMVRADSCSWMS